MNFTIRVLGTASAMPVPGKNPSAQVLSVRGRLFLLDCGEATQFQLAKYGISYMKISAIFISHIHGDHVFGLFGLLSTMAMMGRTAELNIYGPRNLGPIINFFISYFGAGLKYEIKFNLVNVKDKELIYENSFLEIYSFPLNHNIDTYAYVFQEKAAEFLNVHKYKIEQYNLTLKEIAAVKRGEDLLRDDELIPNEELAYEAYSPRSYAFCTDNHIETNILPWLSGLDVLYHECTYLAGNEELARQRFHSTSTEVAQLAKDAKVGKLLIGHYSSRWREEKLFEDECKLIFPNTIALKDGDLIEIEKK